MKAAPKLSTERGRAILAHACESRAKGELFTTIMNSELEALAQELIDGRGAVAILLNLSDAKLELVRAELAAALERVSKSSPENGHDHAGKNIHARGASRK